MGRARWLEVLKRVPRVLLTTEGSYPFAVGGVSCWAQQLLERVNAEFTVVALWGPRRTQTLLPLPRNVKDVVVVHLFRPVGGPLLKRKVVLDGLDKLFGFIDGDLASFAEGLYELAKVGERSSLWEAFLSRETDELFSKRFAPVLGRVPVLAERLMVLGQLRGMLAGLLRLPPAADLAHASVSGLGAIPAWLAARHYKIPFVLTEHGVHLRERYLGFFASDFPPAVSLFFSLFFKNLARLMYRDATVCTSVSEFNRYWQVEFGAQPEKTVVIPNGIDPGEFPPAPRRLEEPPTAVWVGRVDPLKDIVTLVRAFALVHRRIPSARLRLFGPVPKGNEGYVMEVQREAEALGLTGTVSFEGPISPVYPAYHSGWTGVLSSVSEGFPYVAVENLAVGRPLVGTRTGAMPEIIANAGRVVPPANPEALADALTEFLSDPDLCLELGALGRERVLKEYTVDRTVERYRSLYARLVGSHGQRKEGCCERGWTLPLAYRTV